MTAKELAEKILKMIKSGELNPNAIVVRPFCMCDENNGWIEAEFIDRVSRTPIKANSDRQMFQYGNSDDENAIMTLKLG